MNKYEFHPLKSVKPLKNYQLLATFKDNSKKTYDVKPLFGHYEMFKDLKNIDGLFVLARVDFNGYAVVWNDSIDISSEEIWNNGKSIS